MRWSRRLRPGVATELRATVIRQSRARATGRRRYHLSLNRWVLTLTTFGALGLPVAAAQADATWTGASTSANWSDATNWSGTTPPTGTLSFPTLGSCGTCYTSNNDLSGISATSLVFGNQTPKSQYMISGNSFTIGGGGINDTPGGSTGDVIKAPIALSASQTWAVGPQGDYNSLTLLRGVTGSSSNAVTMSIQEGDLFVDSDMEAGPVTKSGPGGLHIGGAPGSNQPGSINATDGQPVTVNGGFVIPNPSSKTGPLSITGATLLLGTNPSNNGTTTLNVNGSATLGSSITTSTYINNNGPTPGTDFSQLSASGDIMLGGTLALGQGPSNNTGPCVPLTAGDVATLVKANGTLSGTFANAPDGATLTMASSCRSPLPKLQINYTGHTVTATVLGDTATKLAMPSPSPASTNQMVTLTATVTGTSAPKGTVAFLANGSTISGCAGQPLTTHGSSGTATCQASFPASGSPESLSAAFTPANGSNQGPSISSPQTLTVNPAAPAAALQASNTSPPAGTSVTYTATVTPAFAGTSQPSGTVAFLDGGSSISGCTAQPLSTGSASTATCTVTYPAAGSHTITATYAGDPNFSGSSSPPATVTVQPTPAPPGGGSGGTGLAPGVSSGTPRGPARLVLSRVAQSRIRWREPHARSAPGVRSVPVGTRFTFRVSRSARVTLTFVQTLSGERSGGRCRAPGTAAHRARACHRTRTRGRLIESVGAGTHHLGFSGRVGPTSLPRGSYSVVVTAAAPSGARSRAITLHFIIVG
jgi:hypothetical protein